MKQILRRIYVYFLLGKLTIGYKVLGIEYINRYLTSATQNVRDILNHFGASICDNAIVHGPLTIHNAENDYSKLSVGHGVHIGRDVFLDLTENIYIGDHSIISMRCILLTHQDVGNRPLKKHYPRRTNPLIISRGCYIGCNVTILCGVSVGEFAVVGSGAVVTKDLPTNILAIGIPAKIVKNFDFKHEN